MRVRRVIERIKDATTPPEGRLLFAHIPKCAGTTVRVYLERQYRKNRIFRTYVDGSTSEDDHVRMFQAYPKKRRDSYRLILGHNAHRLWDAVHPDTRGLIILRDPVERIVSHYHYVRRLPEHYLHAATEGMPLERYVAPGFSDETRNWMTGHFSGRSRDEVAADPGGAVAEAVRVIGERYDYVGFADDLASVLRRVARDLGFAEPFDASRVLNRGDGRSVAEPPEEQALRAVAEANAFDIELYEALKRRFA